MKDDEIEKAANQLNRMLGRSLLERRARELLQGVQVYDDATRDKFIAAMLADDVLMAAADALVPAQIAQVEEAIDSAKTFYQGSDGKLVRITEMANGHLHNACAAMKRKRLGGVWAFTILAMDAEIARRGAEAKKENQNG